MTRPIAETADFTCLDRYVRRQAGTVSGYLRTLDLHVLATLGRMQTERRIHAGMLEIGVHHGKLFFILAALRQGAERALAIDLFEDDAVNRGAHRGRDVALLENARRLGIELDTSEVLRRDSTTLVADDILSRTGRPRIVSIDGGHDADVVASDLALAGDVLHNAGIVAVDDFANTLYPDVRTATLAFLTAEADRFAPFLMTPGKLYFCRRQEVERYRDLVCDDRLVTARRSSSTILRDPVTIMQWPRREAARRMFNLFAFALVDRFRHMRFDGRAVLALGFAG